MSGPRKRTKMGDWLVKLLRGKQGREADALCEEVLCEMQTRKQKIDRHREERESRQYAISGRSIDIDLTQF